MKLILMHVGRIFLALYFLIPGISKFTSWNTSVALMEAHNMKMIPTLLAIAGIAQVVGSISLLLNRYVVICALGFAAMISHTKPLRVMSISQPKITQFISINLFQLFAQPRNLSHNKETI